MVSGTASGCKINKKNTLAKICLNLCRGADFTVCPHVVVLDLNTINYEKDNNHGSLLRHRAGFGRGLRLARRAYRRGGPLAGPFVPVGRKIPWHGGGRFHRCHRPGGTPETARAYRQARRHGPVCPRGGHRPQESGYGPRHRGAGGRDRRGRTRQDGLRRFPLFHA